MGTEASRNVPGRHLSVGESTSRIHDAALTRRSADGQFHHGQLWDASLNAIEDMHFPNGGRVIISFTDHVYRTWQVHIPVEHISLMEVRFGQTFFNEEATRHTHFAPNE
jgi:hypothetical protein